MDETAEATEDQAATAEEISALTDEAVERMDRVSETMNDMTAHSGKQARLARKVFEIVERIRAGVDEGQRLNGAVRGILTGLRWRSIYSIFVAIFTQTINIRAVRVGMHARQSPARLARRITT